ncbi:fumarate/nitrate reduction transcriptional regulator Fnr [Brachymonas sp. G13]|uniref:fumarate/nitrate reduction transcriptional regulator Fnr n=1 Tax=Brachymonas TaxID=28219 RepID=UPI0016A79EC5|nr:fumarate/nitrate reduction transcriptional regulator Fnr [Brachymonas sp. J145]MEE1653485.1 fumarate/nitrate reduction transcriptional regulator Fnr [Brachymonas sp. J145]NLX17202.1 fumarate/nitrate reduction transcriptional regulator Fnr [Ramlibacter sp.]
MPATTFSPLKVNCSNCNLRDLCMPVEGDADDMDALAELISARRKFKRGDVLYSHGEPFTNLYAVRTGFFKTVVTTPDGREQVTGFHMAGEIVGLDGIVNDQHTCDAVALEDAEICVLPFSRMSDISRQVPALQTHVHKLMSREIVRDQNMMLLLGSMRAEERLAAFLLNLVQRLHVRGLSQSELVLRMTREEIGSYLGIKLETVSRMFSRFADEGILEVRQRHVHIIDPEALERIVNQQGA